MDKQHALELLGGSIPLAAKKIGITYQAIEKWPAVLTPAIRDRVQAALYREMTSRKPRKPRCKPTPQTPTTAQEASHA
ncbi:MAG: hypothetical protein RL299_1983 [Pseudomonadota bacterium]